MATWLMRTWPSHGCVHELEAAWGLCVREVAALLGAFNRCLSHCEALWLALARQPPDVHAQSSGTRRRLGRWWCCSASCGRLPLRHRCLLSSCLDMWRLNMVVTLEHNSKQTLGRLLQLANMVLLGSSCALRGCAELLRVNVTNITHDVS